METEMEIRASYVSDPIRITFLPAAVQRSWSPEPIIGNGNHWKLQQDTTRGRCTVVCRVGSQKGQCQEDAHNSVHSQPGSKGKFDDSLKESSSTLLCPQRN